MNVPMFHSLYCEVWLDPVFEVKYPWLPTTWILYKKTLAFLDLVFMVTLSKFSKSVGPNVVFLYLVFMVTLSKSSKSVAPHVFIHKPNSMSFNLFLKF